MVYFEFRFAQQSGDSVWCRLRHPQCLDTRPPLQTIFCNCVFLSLSIGSWALWLILLSEPKQGCGDLVLWQAEEEQTLPFILPNCCPSAQGARGQLNQSSSCGHLYREAAWQKLLWAKNILPAIAVVLSAQFLTEFITCLERQSENLSLSCSRAVIAGFTFFDCALISGFPLSTAP